ncbi:/ / DNA repair protein RecO / 375425:376135 Reverse [Candidatus Hepatoplasma crinochetorum]|uniref:/ / DNA repair protein RecO / 375425:376135 Reverse n=1 Tax=Candidatus Hepatoplasma crinochetorum TaxID=295596 RepID=A0A0G7ZL58_9MOLU|nr:/ / DNA repair protein RecO / 375425:376135 Reverse [Candidatus Hepatoplasma crinochetorum]
MYKKEILYLYYIKEYKEYEAMLYFLRPSGQKITLRAKGFFKEESKNIHRFKINTFIKTEYFSSPLNDYGILKTGEKMTFNYIKKESHLNLLNLFNKLLILTEGDLNKQFYNTIYYIFTNFDVGILNWNLNLFYLLTQILIAKDVYIELKKCVICNRNSEISSFSFDEGGLVCKRHLNQNIKIMNADLIKKIIFLFKTKSLKRLNNISLTFAEEKILLSLYASFFNDVLGYKINFYR